ncbi:hypothetical protein COCSUDRAFT_56577 [Coccomyxa subellipsoidea C-169]|uniref:DUF7607 domain-containing protein n=1 Tax=Coccomyxa subellipsoidea (strain C-169) TaxID=574566 RepID=I0YSI9_COCSC|nr:hypothetical protein COCSUDRAFT_56577 [Coccomyxa subellipsoidea C-169]EIE21358.1 hypothetical protein COCSUDRAFT_56577 [Coccomyxa subellipsoidea C-169]|eukprot:XP_005645902.1 hypothetical protein COCSUDRAFT_56577 [Coccomyxa subellipsoidea C-169]
MSEAIGLHELERLWETIQAQIQEQERKLRIRDEWQRALDELEAENQRKKVELEAEIQRKKLELNKRYTEQLALQDQPAPTILLPGPSQANVSPNAERSMPAAPPAAAAAASHDHQVLLSNGSLTGGAPGAKTAADGSPYAGEAVDQPMSDDLAGPSGQQDNTGAAMDFSDGGAEDNDAEPFPDSMFPDSEDEAEASDLLHATRDAPRQSVETWSRLADSSHSNTDEDEAQASGQAGSRERADAEAASGSGAVAQGKRRCAWPSHLWGKLGLEPPEEPSAALAPWRTKLKALKTDIEELAEDDNGPYGWAYLLGREGLSYQKGQQKLLRRQLWSGFTPMEDVTSSEGSDDDEDGSGDSAFQVLSGELPDKGEAQSSGVEEGEEEDDAEDATAEDLLFEDSSMRTARDRVKAAIKALLVAALLQEPRASALLEIMAGHVAKFAQDLVDKRQWGSARVLTPAILGRIATALETTIEELAGMAAKWQEKHVPRLEQRAYRFWRLGRAAEQRECWTHDQHHTQASSNFIGRLLDLVVKALEAHVGNHGVSVKALRRHSQSLEATLFLILERDFQLRSAALPKAPLRPQSTSKRKERKAEEGQQDAADGGDISDDASTGSWLVSDDEDAGQPAEADTHMEEAGGGVGDDGIEGESLHSGSEGDDDEEEGEGGEEGGRDRAWNAAGLAPGATQVLVAGRRSLQGAPDALQPAAEPSGEEAAAEPKGAAEKQEAADMEEAAEPQAAAEPEVAAEEAPAEDAAMDGAPVAHPELGPAEQEADAVGDDDSADQQAPSASQEAGPVSPPPPDEALDEDMGLGAEAQPEGSPSSDADAAMRARSLQRSLLQQFSEAPVPEESAPGDTVAKPIVLESDGDGDGDVDVQTADDFVQGTEVEVRNAGSETWSPGRVHSAFGTNITVEVPAASDADVAAGDGSDAEEEDSAPRKAAERGPGRSSAGARGRSTAARANTGREWSPPVREGRALGRHKSKGASAENVRLMEERFESYGLRLRGARSSSGDEPHSRGRRSVSASGASSRATSQGASKRRRPREESRAGSASRASSGGSSQGAAATRRRMGAVGRRSMLAKGCVRRHARPDVSDDNHAAAAQPDKSDDEPAAAAGKAPFSQHVSTAGRFAANRRARQLLRSSAEPDAPAAAVGKEAGWQGAAGRLAERGSEGLIARRWALGVSRLRRRVEATDDAQQTDDTRQRPAAGADAGLSSSPAAAKRLTLHETRPLPVEAPASGAESRAAAELLRQARTPLSHSVSYSPPLIVRRRLSPLRPLNVPSTSPLPLDGAASDGSREVKRAKVYQPPSSFTSASPTAPGQKSRGDGSAATASAEHGSLDSKWRQQQLLQQQASGRRRPRSRSRTGSREATPRKDEDIVVDLTQSDSGP